MFNFIYMGNILYKYYMAIDRLVTELNPMKSTNYNIIKNCFNSNKF